MKVRAWLGDLVPISVYSTETDRFCALFNIITERKLAEHALKESEERLRLFIEHAPAALAMFDRDMRYLAVSHRWMIDYDLNRGDIIGRSHYELFPEIPERWREVHLRGLEGEVVRVEEDSFERLDGSTQWLRWEVRPWYAVDGAVGGVVIFTEDITERRRAEEELRTTSERFYSILANQPAGVLLVAEEDRVEFANQAFCDQFDLAVSPSALQGLASQEIIQQIRRLYEDPDQAIDRIRDIVRNRQPVQAEEVPMHGGKALLRYYTPIQVNGKPYGRLWHHLDISDRKKAEEELRISEERLRLAMEAAKAGTWEWDVLRNENFWSDEAWALYGLEPHSLPPTFETWRGTVHPDDLEAAERALWDAASNGTDMNLEWRTCDSQGNERWLMSRGRPVCDENGQAVHYRGIVLDITERKLAEQALHELKNSLEIRVKERTAELEEANSVLEQEVLGRMRAQNALVAERQRLFDILETMPFMVCLLTEDYHVSFANRPFRERFGESLGRHCYDYCFGSPEPCEFCESYNVLKTGQAHEWEVTGPDGSIIAAYDFPFVDVDGSALILEVDIDITQQRRAEAAVKAERQRLYDVLETLPVFVCLLDEHYRMPFANRYFREAFGESLGRPCHEFLYDREEPCERCEAFTVFKTGAPHNWAWRAPNGRSYEIFGFPFIDEDGSTLVLEMGIDMTERMQAEDALQQTLADLTRSNEDLQQFAYVASHDLQEPLRNVAGCVQLLEKKYKGRLGSDADQYIRYAVESVTRMKALILDLLAYSRVATKAQPPERVDCENLLDAALKNLRSAVDEAGAVVTHDPLPTVFADVALMSQVFQNLIGNAIKFRGEEPPRIHVSSSRTGNEWAISIKDNGIGIEPRHLARVFVIFQRLHKRDKYDGTGMGLAIVKKIVERHGGRIWAESEPGVGSTFHFTIPNKRFF